MAAASDISWSGPDGTFNLRVAAIIRRGEEVLLCTVDGLDYWRVARTRLLMRVRPHPGRVARRGWNCGIV